MPSPQQPAGSAGQPNLPVNTLRIKAHELAKLSEELDATSRGGAHSRKCIRWDFLQLSVRIEMRQPAGATTSLRYAARNISAEGLGILHNSYVYPGTNCVVYLPTNDKKEMPIDAIVRRCRHVKGLVHEVGISFKVPIDLREFMNVDPMEGRFTLEHVDASKLSGSLLHVDNSAMDRRLVRHYLKDTSLNVVNTEDATTALARVKENFDVIIVDSDLPDMSGSQLAEKLRAQGISSPIIVLTADNRQATKDALKAAKVSAMLTKPASQDRLLQAIAEFLLLEGSSGAESGGHIYTSLKAEDPTNAFVAEFIEELSTISGRLSKAVDEDDLTTARRLCFQLKGAAPALGFFPLGEAADAAMLSLDATMSVHESIKQVRNVISMCKRVRVRESLGRAG